MTTPVWLGDIVPEDRAAAAFAIIESLLWWLVREQGVEVAFDLLDRSVDGALSRGGEPAGRVVQGIKEEMQAIMAVHDRARKPPANDQ
jgi:hypothetical protein